MFTFFSGKAKRGCYVRFSNDSASWSNTYLLQQLKVQCHLLFWFSTMLGQESIVVQSLSHVWLWDPIGYSLLGFPVLHYVPESTQTHVHWVSVATQPSHPLSSPSLDLKLSQHQSLFQWVGSSHQVAKVLELQLQHQSFQWIFRVDFLQDWLVWSPCGPRDPHVSSSRLQKLELTGPETGKVAGLGYEGLCVSSGVKNVCEGQTLKGFNQRSKCAAF